jgi:hypothetical protein
LGWPAAMLRFPNERYRDACEQQSDDDRSGAIQFRLAEAMTQRNSDGRND